MDVPASIKRANEMREELEALIKTRPTIGVGSLSVYEVETFTLLRINNIIRELVMACAVHDAMIDREMSRAEFWRGAVHIEMEKNLRAERRFNAKIEHMESGRALLNVDFDEIETDEDGDRTITVYRRLLPRATEGHEVLLVDTDKNLQVLSTVIEVGAGLVMLEIVPGTDSDALF